MKSNFQLITDPIFGFRRISPTPTEEEIEKFYSEEFYSEKNEICNDSSLEVQSEDREFYEGSWSDMVHYLENISGQRVAGQSVLDIGCGWAQCLLYLSKLGMDCYGFDPAPEAAEYGRQKGLNIKQAGLRHMLAFEDQRFDVVLLNNVLEHLPNPEKALREIGRHVLKANGILVIDVPNEFNSLQVAGRLLHDLPEWWVAPPGHLNYFSRETLTNLLDGTGFKVEIAEASFPLEIFLLFGDCYVGDPVLGKQVHKKRVAFELNMRRIGQEEKLRELYRTIAGLGIGRQIRIYAKLLKCA